MKDEEKNINEEEVKTEENGVQLNDEEMAEVVGGAFVRGFAPKEVLVL